MARQNSIQGFSGGKVRSIVCNKCLRKVDDAASAEISVADLNRIETALRLRIEACDDNKEFREANRWRAVYDRVVELRAIARKR